jgi:hypothetical protein
MDKDRELEIKILEHIDALSKEELYKNNQPLKLEGFEKKVVTYKAFEMEEDGLIEAFTMDHSAGVEGVIVKGLTKEGKHTLKEYRETWFDKLFPLYKEKFWEQLAENLAKWTIYLIFLGIGILIGYLL